MVNRKNGYITQKNSFTESPVDRNGTEEATSQVEHHCSYRKSIACRAFVWCLFFIFMVFFLVDICLIRNISK
uniref:Uncharacterized protein n=1 Tax=Octopus bimaculoides TaxID=37653 RepID=A0A0L8GXM6_OCTBM